MSGNGPARLTSGRSSRSCQRRSHCTTLASLQRSLIGAQSKALYNLNHSGRENDHERRAPVRVLLSSVNGPIEGVRSRSQSQQAQVRDYVAASHGRLVGEYSETVSGLKNESLQLAMALTTCRILDAVLVIARLDRLSRNVAKRKPKSRFRHRREATPAHARLINGPVALDKKSTES
jgi:hypothetical protein